MSSVSVLAMSMVPHEFTVASRHLVQFEDVFLADTSSLILLLFTSTPPQPAAPITTLAMIWNMFTLYSSIPLFHILIIFSSPITSSFSNSYSYFIKIWKFFIFPFSFLKFCIVIQLQLSAPFSISQSASLCFSMFYLANHLTCLSMSTTCWTLKTPRKLGSIVSNFMKILNVAKFKTLHKFLVGIPNDFKLPLISQNSHYTAFCLTISNTMNFTKKINIIIFMLEFTQLPTSSPTNISISIQPL